MRKLPATAHQGKTSPRPLAQFQVSRIHSVTSSGPDARSTAKISGKLCKESSGCQDVVLDSSSLTLVVPAMPIEEIASQFYFNNFNIVRSTVTIQRQYSPMRTKSSSMSVTTVGLAGLAITHRDSSLMNLARMKYSLALQLLSRAVLDPKEATLGSTATASFNLSVFEMLISDGHGAAYQWLKHIHGTIALIRAVCLPKEDVQNAIKGCLQATACLISERPIPQYMNELVKSCNDYSVAEDVHSIVELFILMGGLINFYIQAKQTRNKSPRHLISALLEIDAALVSWTDRLSPAWMGHPSSGNPLYRPEDRCLPRFWAYYRLCRVLAHRVILDNLDILRTQSHNAERSNFSAQDDKSRSILSAIPRDLYASIPLMLKASYPAGRTSISLDSDVFFLITILQALLKLTGKEQVTEKWSVDACQELGDGFNTTKDFITAHLS
ncbi:hypothetical protein ARAM_001187 [Aspergillus rambellii]|uniref:Transcription factor domain-containing protein n=1 Tax=Aspergillus rambellii TaxID=308745 RepID=A0A0F8TZU4_9EURO|nr:hypothetical protein ARAM_001187 [Aspergillus rambellii]